MERWEDLEMGEKGGFESENERLQNLALSTLLLAPGTRNPALGTWHLKFRI